MKDKCTGVGVKEERSAPKAADCVRAWRQTNVITQWMELEAYVVLNFWQPVSLTCA